MPTIRRDLPVRAGHDVVVCGGGSAGVAAAVSAAEEGLRVLLVERAAQVGGMGTSGLVSHWLGGRTSDCSRWVVGGLFRQWSMEAARRGIAVIPSAADYADAPYTPHGAYKALLHGIPFDPFAMAQLLEEQLLDAGVDLLYQVQAVDVVAEGHRITHVVLAGKDGLCAANGDVFVDATGDADLAARSGCGSVKGAEEDGVMSPISLIFHVEGVDEQALMAYITAEDDPRFRKLLAALHERGEELLNYTMMIFVKLNREGVFMVNGRCLPDVDGTDPASRTRALVDDRRRIEETLRLFRKHFPGLENAQIKAVASDLGVRETRRIDGEYRMTVEDVREGAAFPDTIGFTPYGWDLSDRAGQQPMHGVSKPPIVPIPYRIMVPRPITNLICPGRAVSVERHVLGPMRVMAPVMAMGEAAGAAAKQAAEGPCAFRDVDAEALRRTLRNRDAVVAWPDPAQQLRSQTQGATDA